MPSVWILSDGLPGHYNQSIGLSRALQRAFKLDVEIVEIRLKSKAFRSPMRFIANQLPWLLGRRAFFRFYTAGELPSQQPRMIVSAGGNTLFANIALSRAFRVPNLYSGTLKGYRAELLSRVFTVVPLADAAESANNVVLDLPPANIKPATETAIQTATNSTDEGVYTLLIGGEGAGYHYVEDDWLKLAEAVNRLANQAGIQWKITTSRRTGEKAELLLRNAIDANVIDEAVWFSINPQKVVKRFLEQGRIVFCTEDSLTMVSEAIYSHKPVVTLQPASMHPEQNDAMALEKYHRRGFIKRTQIGELANLSLDPAQFCQDYPDITQQIVVAVKGLLR